MQTFPAFQLLPPHVVEMIVNHVTGSSRLCYEGIDREPYGYGTLVSPLLSVCHNFRAFVYTCFCRKYEICLYEFGGKIETRRYSWLPYHKELGYPTHHLAKDLDIGVNLQLILQGEALRQLSATPYDGCAFPLVRTLSIDIFGLDDASSTDDDDDDDDYSNEWSTFYPPDAAVNIAAFVRRLKEMVPAAGNVIMTSIYNGDSLQRGNTHMMDLAQRLFDLAEKHTTIDYNEYEIAYHVNLAPIRDLVHIRCSINNVPDLILALAHRCAQTLRMLDIYGESASAMAGLIRDPDSGAYVVYPRLHALTTAMYSASEESLPLVCNGAVPFPSLCRLRINDDYPFDDDVVFRGNLATLESLRLALRPAGVAMLEKYNVFTPTSHPRLQCVNTFYNQESTPDLFASFALYSQFALNIAPNAAVRAISELPNFGRGHPLKVSSLSNHASIQVLVLPKVCLSFCDAINLFKSLPLLSDLHTAAPTLDGLGQGIAMAELPDYVRSTFAPVGQRFRCWHFGQDAEINYYKELATFMLLLALVCPNFDYVAVSKDDREPFMRVIKRMTSEPGFIQYAPRLRRFLFDGWRRPLFSLF